MEQIVCKFCGKVMEGYNHEHVEYMLAQHMLAKHRNEPKKDESGQK